MIKNRKAFVLITALLFSSIIIIMTIPYIARVTADYKLMMKMCHSTAALDVAEAGIERALWELAWNSSTFSGWTKTSNVYDISDSLRSSNNVLVGDYDVRAEIYANGNATVTATGYTPNKARFDSKRTIKVTYESNHAFQMAVAGLNSITMSGQASTDSYDSSLGAYNALVGGVRNVGQEGDIASNGAITLGSNTAINGDANPGPDYPFSGTPPVTGSYGTLQAPLVAPPIVLPSNIATVNDNSRIAVPGNPPPEIFRPGTYDLVLSGTTNISLPTGTYYFTSLTMSGQSTINVTGAATIYIDGSAGGTVDVSITGQGIMNNTGIPGNLLIYYTGSAVKLSGQGSFSGAIYAPSATVTMSGQADIYGSVVCGSNVDSGQASIHYDVNLRNVLGPGSSRVTSWQETQ